MFLLPHGEAQRPVIKRTVSYRGKHRPLEEQLCPRKGTLHVEGFAWLEQRAAAAGDAGCTSAGGPCRARGELSRLGTSGSHRSC